ncbi:MAG TPA: diaminopimelate epimerase, partial [Longimicrobiales bacterium]|nr:diaminopimelate epimerase [Longimicrobiales bacterium]
MRFSKGQALGNDYHVVDAADHPGGLDTPLAILLCDRHRGAGSDGVLYADLAATPFHLRIINPDGTEAEKSGNGLRIFGAYLYHHGRVPRGEWFDVRLAKDTVSMRVEEELDAGAVLIRARMGGADFHGAAVGFTPEAGEVFGYELELPRGGSAAVNTVSLGNPHCVVFVDDLERADFVERAPQLCTHSAFSAGTNVQFARVIGPAELEAWIWERGAGETMASGSSACAVAAAAVRRGFVQPGQFIVQMEGGSVEITVGPDYQVELLGPAQMVYE